MTPRPRSRRHPFVRLVVSAGIGLVAVLVLPGGLSGQSCPDDGICAYSSCRSPASSVPATYWGDLRPTDEGTLPAQRDSTLYNDISQIGSFLGGNIPQWTSLDIENGWIFAGVAMGLQIWDARGSAAAQPVRKANVKGPSQFPIWTHDLHEVQAVRDLDAPPGNDNVVAIAVNAAGGLVVFDTSDKTSPRGAYGDRGKLGKQVWAGRVGGRDYAFLATQTTGLLAYDLTTAAASAGCIEETPAVQSCGVYRGRIGLRDTVNFVDGVSDATGTRMWVVSSSGLPSLRGFEIHNVSTPGQSPQPPILSGLADTIVQGVALWRRGASYYLAVRVTAAAPQGRIYDVTNCLVSGVCSLGAPIAQLTMTSEPSEYYVTWSSAQGRDFLYFGGVSKCLGGLQSEWLFDVTVPSQPFELMKPLPSQPASYWGWYYRRNATGFNNVGPRAGKFNGPYFYRAAMSIFDVHQLATPTPPTADFDYQPKPVYAGDPTSFVDLSSSAPSSWSWSFQDATPATSSQADPSGVVFQSPGAKAVSLTASNGLGSDTEQKTIQVVDPSAAVEGVSASPQSPVVCQPVTLTPVGATGKPPLHFNWQVLDAGNALAAGGSGPSFVWDTNGAPAGDYNAVVTVTNQLPGGDQAQATVNLASLPELPASGQFTPTATGPPEGAVDFEVVVQGATEFCWSFGDGDDYPEGCTTNPSLFTDDPEQGPDPPVHSYTEIGTYEVTVRVRNCVDTTPRASAPLTVTITNVEPLVAGFQAQGICSGFGGLPCIASVGQPITFADSSLGSPESYEYDWDGDGDYDETSTTPITSHTYTAATPSGQNHVPRLRVRRGVEEDVHVHQAIQVGQAVPKSITISGPSSGTVGQALSFTASASGCSASSNGWSWTATGATISGGNGAQASITWSSVGSKLVQATNSGCGTTGGSKSVSITSGGGPNPGPGPGPFDASFTYSPSSPQVGQPVSFTSNSSGSPTSYRWKFGDGSESSGSATTSHAYAAGGSYSVELAISKQDSSCEPWGVCEDSAFRTVIVSGKPVLSAHIGTPAFCSGSFCFASTGDRVELNDSSQGDVESREWDLGDGSTSTASSLTHVWRRPGAYTVTLTVSDGEETDEATLVFSVDGDPLGGVETTLGAAPAATLLFPYFSVDLEHADGETTLVGFTNVGNEPRLAQVTLWTNWGIPTLSFPVYLSGYDVYSLNLRDVLNGHLLATGPLSSNRGLEDVPEKAFPACGGEDDDLPQPSLSAARLKALHTGEPAPEDGLCASAPDEPGIAVGYVTVDVVRECSFSSPADDGYFSADDGVAAYDNVLIGEFFFIDSADDSAQAELAVHVRANESLFANGDYTFYGRYVGGDGSDKRQPLASVFESHYLNGGAFTGGTKLLVWRDTKSPSAEPLECGDLPEWGPLPENQIVVFDEGGNVTFDGEGERFPWATQRVDVGDSVPIAAPAGRVQVDLNHGGEGELFGNAAQAFVLSTFSALGRFSVDLPAKALEGVASEVAAELGGDSGAESTSVTSVDSKRVAAETFDASGFSLSCDVGTVPAATLLYPYFEVDLSSQGLDTLISFENTASEPRLTQVTLWTDWGIPSLSLNVYLSGNDTQTLSLRDVLNGHLPRTGPVASDRGIASVPEVGFPGCGSASEDLSTPFVDVDQLEDFHSGQPAAPSGQCFGSDHGESKAVGFVTVDVVNECSLLRPSDDGYFENGGEGVAANDNVLVGDFFLVNGAQNFAQGGAAVHLRADESSFGGQGYTFYGRFVNGGGDDNRQPLGSVYATRYLQGGAFDGGTQLVIWRDSKSADVGPVACGGEPAWSPLDKPRIEVMNEDGIMTFSGRRGGYNSMTQIVGVGGAKLPIEDPFGHVTLDLNHEGTGLFEGSAQAWVGVLFSAQGRFSTGLPAYVLGRVCGSP
jgi:PKD repeat protein